MLNPEVNKSEKHFSLKYALGVIKLPKLEINACHSQLISLFCKLSSHNQSQD